MKFLASLILLAATVLGVAAPAAIQRNPWTTNILPQVSAGTNILIITNAGHKLVVNAIGGGGGDSLWTNQGPGTLRSIGDGVYTNFYVDTNVAAMTIGSIASIDPTNGNAFYGAGAGSNNVLTITGSVGVGSDAFGNNSGAVSDSLAFGEAAFRDNSGTISISSAIGQGAGGANISSIENSTLIGSSAMANNAALKRGVVAIGHQALSTWASAALTNAAMVGSVIGDPTTGVNLGSFGFNNNFLNIGASSNRWIIGWNGTNTRANSMVFGNSITNYNFRNVEYTFPAAHGPSNSLLVNNGAGILIWGNPITNLTVEILRATNSFTVFGTMTNFASIIPGANVTYDLGSSARYFSESYLNNIRLSGSYIWFQGAGSYVYYPNDANGVRFRNAGTDVFTGGFGTVGLMSSLPVFADRVVATNGVTTPRLTNSVAITNQSPYAWSNFTAASVWTNYNQRSIVTFDVIQAGSLTGEVVLSTTNGAITRQFKNGSDATLLAIGRTNTVRYPVGPTNTFGFQTNGTGATTANVTIEPE